MENSINMVSKDGKFRFESVAKCAINLVIKEDKGKIENKTIEPGDSFDYDADSQAIKVSYKAADKNASLTYSECNANGTVKFSDNNAGNPPATNLAGVVKQVSSAVIPAKETL